MDSRKASLAIAGIGVLFYLPFAARFFMGDDWLWLAAAHRVWDAPQQLLERPIYGYFRPVATGLLAVWSLLGGPHAWVYSSISLLLHGSNTFLLYHLLGRLAAPKGMAIIASFLFAIYYLNAPVVAWISATPDLIVTTFTLTLCLAATYYAENLRRIWLAAAALAWMLASLAKESGFVSLAILLLTLIFLKKKLLRPPLLWFTLALSSLAVCYLLVYFSGRQFVDKELVFGPSLLINVWFLLGYLIFPLSGRIAAMMPEGAHWFLYLAKIGATVAVPCIAWFVWRRGNSIVRLFSLWCLIFILPVSLFDWDVTLLSLYPERTASRYMYAANIGMAVLAGSLLHFLWRKWINGLRFNKGIVIILATLVTASNAAIVYRITAKYRLEQSLDRQNFMTVKRVLAQGAANGLLIVVPNIEQAPQFIADTSFMSAMALVGTGAEIPIRIIETPEIAVSHTSTILYWDSNTQLLVESPPMSPLIDSTTSALDP